MVLHFITIIGVADTLNIPILTTFFTIVVGFAAAAIAIAFIIAVGVGGALGSQDYIADNIDDRVESAQESVAIEEDQREEES